MRYDNQTNSENVNGRVKTDHAVAIWISDAINDNDQHDTGPHVTALSYPTSFGIKKLQFEQKNLGAATIFVEFALFFTSRFL